MAREYPVACSSCGAEVFAPFVPTPGRILECPSCLITHNNMAQSPYINEFIAFLFKKLSLTRDSTVDVIRAEGKIYDVIFARKGPEVEFIAVIEWAPKDSERLRIPNIALANIQIKTKDPAITEAIIEFISEFGKEVSIPNAPI